MNNAKQANLILTKTMPAPIVPNRLTCQFSQIAVSIKQFGFNKPPLITVLIDKDDVIIAGHGRVLAAKELGLDAVPTIRLERLN